MFGDNPDDTSDLLALLGKPPHVIKLVEGSQGNGVVLAESASGSRNVIDAFRGLYANFLVQEFIAEAKGADIRCFVVGDNVVAAMRRQGEPGRVPLQPAPRRLRPTSVKLTAAERETALRAAKVMGLEVAGVDLLRSRRGPLVLEVNSSPGLEGIEGASGVDVAGAIIELLAARASSRSRPTRRRSAKQRNNQSLAPELTFF